MTTATTLDHLQALYPPGTPGEVLAYVKNPFCRRFGVPANLPALARQIHELDCAGARLLSDRQHAGRPRHPQTRKEHSRHRK